MKHLSLSPAGSKLPYVKLTDMDTGLKLGMLKGGGWGRGDFEALNYSLDLKAIGSVLKQFGRKRQ